MARILFLLLCFGFEAHALHSDWMIAEEKLRAAGNFDAEFINALHAASSDEDFEQILELNTLLFLKRNDYHGVQVTSEASAAVETFTKKNAAAFAKEQKDFGVSPRTIASLLWMESRHGRNQGRFLIANVFTDLLQSEEAATLKHLLEASARFTTSLSHKQKRGIATRARKRVQWAIAELRSVEKMWRRDPTILKTLRGSFAGAIGMPQFEPSSFTSYARAYNSGRSIPDLNRADDAIQSVGCYLKQNGWRLSKRGQMRALLRYNKSHDYARAILKLAAKSSRPNSRVPAGD